MRRREIFEDCIEPVLGATGLGYVSGEGSSLGEPRSDGSRPITFCGIDVDTTQRGSVPIGTKLHCARAGTLLPDEFVVNGRRLDQSRTYLHPGFDR